LLFIPVIVESIEGRIKIKRAEDGDLMFPGLCKNTNWQ
jgi:hypothetical protein